MDLRTRAMAAVDEGVSRRAAAARFGIAPSTVIRWDGERRRTGSFAPKPQGGDTRSRRIEAHAALILATVAERCDITLAELRAHLAGLGVASSASSLSRFFQRHGISVKKRPGTRPSRTAPTS